jgi:hypothetical protein
LRIAQSLLALALVLTFVISACDFATSSNRSVRSSTASPLSLNEAPTPPLRVRRYETSGAYPQVRDGNVDHES